MSASPEPMTGGSPEPGILHRLVRRGPRLRSGEACEMCSEQLEDSHPHLVDVEDRNLTCVCRACSLLFTPPGAAEGRFRAVPDRVVALPAGQLTPQMWDRLEIPVSVAFFFINSALDQVVVLYPGASGTTESLLPLEAWTDLLAAAAPLRGMEPDVEALLVRAPQRGGTVSAHIVPIDRCYELTGRLRSVWRGFDGGPDAQQLLDGFFDSLARAAANGRAPRAGP